MELSAESFSVHEDASVRKDVLRRVHRVSLGETTFSVSAGTNRALSPLSAARLIPLGRFLFYAKSSIVGTMELFGLLIF